VTDDTSAPDIGALPTAEQVLGYLTEHDISLMWVMKQHSTKAAIDRVLTAVAALSGGTSHGHDQLAAHLADIEAAARSVLDIAGGTTEDFDRLRALVTTTTRRPA